MIVESNEVDYTLVQMLIKKIKDGNLGEIKSYIELNALDVKIIKDTQQDQNSLFFSTLIKEDNQ